MFERGPLKLLAFMALLPLVGCGDIMAPPATSPPANVVATQAAADNSVFDTLADIARQTQQPDGPDIDEPDPFPVDPFPPAPEAELFADEDEIIRFFASPRYQRLKAQALRNLRLANRQDRVRDCQNTNVVLIVIDDLGFGDVGVFGQQQIKTPNIDLLAQTGVRFDNYYAGSSVGVPSHSTLFTGVHTGHGRLRGNSEDASLSGNEFTLGEVMHMAGYDTGMFGSWKLGGPQSPGRPTEQGFEETYGYLNRTNARDYYPLYLWRNELRQPIPGNQNNGREHYSHQLVADEAVEYLRRSHFRPFFMTVFFAPPRGNLDDVPSLEPYSGEDWPREQKQYAAMITRVDDAVGQIMDTLYYQNMKENTVVILTSDNGPHKEGVNPEFFNSNGPFNGIKGTLSEGGLRVPMIVWGPSDIIRAAGSVSHHVWWAPDLLPTIAELAGAWRQPQGIDGISQLAAWQGRLPPEHEYLYWELHEGGFAQAIRHHQWKAIRTGMAEPIKLYDLEKDQGEENDVAQANPEIVRQLAELMQSARWDSPGWPVQE